MNKDYREFVKQRQQAARALSLSIPRSGLFSGFAFGLEATKPEWTVKITDDVVDKEVIKDVVAVDVTKRVPYIPPPIST